MSAAFAALDRDRAGMSASTASADVSRAETGRWHALTRRLRLPTAVDDLLADASDEACRLCGFERAVVLALQGGVFSAHETGVLRDPVSDALRRAALTTALPLYPGSDEAEVTRRGDAARRATRRTSPLADALGLQAAVLAPVVPEDRALAVLVLDRAAPEVEEGDLAAADMFCLHLSAALERVVLRARLTEIRAELQHLTASANAMAREASSAPVMLNSDYGTGPVFSAAGSAASQSGRLAELLSRRELDIAALLITGKSNREIAGELHLSPETVKAYVAKLLRKLGAANRVEAVLRYMVLAGNE